MVTRKHREQKPRATRPAAKPAEPAAPKDSPELVAMRGATSKLRETIAELGAVQGAAEQHGARIASVSARIDALANDVG